MTNRKKNILFYFRNFSSVSLGPSTMEPIVWQNITAKGIAEHTAPHFPVARKQIKI